MAARRRRRGAQCGPVEFAPSSARCRARNWLRGAHPKRWRYWQRRAIVTAPDSARGALQDGSYRRARSGSAAPFQNGGANGSAAPFRNCAAREDDSHRRGAQRGPSVRARGQPRSPRRFQRGPGGARVGQRQLGPGVRVGQLQLGPGGTPGRQPPSPRPARPGARGGQLQLGPGVRASVSSSSARGARQGRQPGAPRPARPRWCARRSAPARSRGARVRQLQLGPVVRARTAATVSAFSSARGCARPTAPAR
jgi:hypothetical protein